MRLATRPINQRVITYCNALDIVFRGKKRPNSNCSDGALFAIDQPRDEYINYVYDYDAFRVIRKNNWKFSFL